MTGAKLSFF